jgi:hypothetical protein
MVKVAEKEAVFQEDVITIRKREITVRTGTLRQDQLRFYPENPRIYSTVWKDEDEPTQHEIFEALSRSEHVREVLVPSIRHNGGLIEPVLVKGKTVLEGNSRLAAYRMLAQGEPGKWELIRVRILPDSITESEVFSLLGEYHIVGKKDWQPYEQAGYLYRRFKKHGLNEQELKDEVGLSAVKIRHLIRVYDFMVQHDDRNADRWSYYDELLKGHKYDDARQLYPHFDEFIVGKIHSSEIQRAVDLRDQLPLITKAGGNTLKKFMSGAYSFDDAVHDARMRGAGDYNVRKISDFRKWLAEEHIDSELEGASKHEKQTLAYELEKIERRIRSLMKRIKPSQ